MDEEFETQSDLELSIHDYVEDNSEPVQEFSEVCVWSTRIIVLGLVYSSGDVFDINEWI